MLSRLSDELLGLLINAATHELHNFNMYAVMSNHLSVKGFTNAGLFMENQINEEQEHFKKVWGYIKKRNAHAILNTVEPISEDFSDLVKCFSSALELEFETTSIYQEIFEKALEEDDGITVLLAQEFLKIQEAEEDEFMTINDELSLIGDNVPLQKLWDNTYEF